MEILVPVVFVSKVFALEVFVLRFLVPKVFGLNMLVLMTAVFILRLGVLMPLVLSTVWKYKA